MGPNHAVVTACSTGAHSIGDAARMIRDDDADIMLAGGAEATICPIGIAGFAQARALNMSYNDRPEQASRPYDKDRDGFVMGEGAGVVVLEEYEHAKARGAKIYAEVVGYGLSGDAYHVTAPHPEGSGAYPFDGDGAEEGGHDPGDIDYINAHGTSTMADTIELGAVKRLFGNAIANVSMSSTKSAIGHLLGGAGAVEAIFCILAIRDQIVPPTLNLDNPDEGTDGVDLVPHKAQEAQGEGRAQQQLRLRRHQRQPDLARALARHEEAARPRAGAGGVAAGVRRLRPQRLERQRARARADSGGRAAGLEPRQRGGDPRASEGALDSADRFLLQARIFGGGEPIKAGEYRDSRQGEPGQGPGPAAERQDAAALRDRPRGHAVDPGPRAADGGADLDRYGAGAGRRLGAARHLFVPARREPRGGARRGCRRR